jgi:4-hydroxythreonine-4-phosphate dehydrogenase
MAVEILGITMGCPVGIGPEIILRFHLEHGGATGFAPVVLGDSGVLARCRDELALDLEIVDWHPGERPKSGAVNVLPLSDLGRDLQWGRPDAVTGRAMGGYIESAVRLIRAGSLAGMVTCPISKGPLNLGGYPYPGHTEMLADLCGGGDYAMMLAGGRLRVTLVTIHVGLARVPALLTAAKIARLIEITGQALRRDFGLAQPRLAVAALNPHAGESGMFGDEERRLIEPGLALAAAAGWPAAGPFPPDTVFHQAAAGRFDAVVCMYHDQGLIPFKLLHFEDGVNVTLGLPIVRTSVDHGTAYDIAGRGVASPASLAAAFRLAAEIVTNRQRVAAGK